MSTHRRFYRPELDVLRWLAFLAVFVHHSGILFGRWLAEVRIAGAFGVCVFFYLSAFLITELLDREWESTGSVHLRAFYMRRILRIWPLYFAMLLVDFVHMRRSGAFTAARLWAFLLLSGNWFAAFQGFLISYSLPLWTISVEEQFYLVWPCLRRLTRRHGAIAICVAAVALSYGTLALLSHWQVELETSVWVNSFVQLQFFAGGALTALLLKSRTPSLTGLARALIFALGAAALFLSQAAFHTKAGVPHAEFKLLLPGYLLVNAGCAAMLISVLGASALGRAKPFVYLGKISYGLYVFHFAVLLQCHQALAILARTHPIPAKEFLYLRAALALPCTILVATLSYRYFEAPILRYKKRFEFVRTRAV